MYLSDEDYIEVCKICNITATVENGLGILAELKGVCDTNRFTRYISPKQGFMVSNYVRGKAVDYDRLPVEVTLRGTAYELTNLLTAALGSGNEGMKSFAAQLRAALPTELVDEYV